MAVKIKDKQQEQYKKLQATDKDMAKNLADAMKVANALPFDVESGMVQVKMAIDVSGSAQKFYKNGDIQKLVDQFLSIAFLFDDNGSIQVYPFDEKVYHHGDKHPYRRGETIDLPEINLENYRGYVDRYITSLVQDGTAYAPAIKAVAQEMSEGGVGFCWFITDGANSDEGAATRAIEEASSIPVFYQFAGIGSSNERDFPFLTKLDNLKSRKLDNAGFYVTHLNEDNQVVMRRMLAEFAGINPDTGAKAGQSYPEKALAAGLVDSMYQWDGKKRL